MKRDWDVIRAVLIEVEGLSADKRNTFIYGTGCGYEDQNATKSEHAYLLWKPIFLTP